MKIKKLMMGPLLANGYILYKQDGSECTIIDPGYSPDVYLSFAKEHSLKVKNILATHYHSDHTGAADRLRDALKCPVFMHSADADLYTGEIDGFLSDGQRLICCGEQITVLWTPGHTRGSVCFELPEGKVCFTGDTLFDTDLGRTDLESGCEEDMKHSIRFVLNHLEDSWMIYPGHEGSCTMKFVRENNREFRMLAEGKERF